MPDRLVDRYLALFRAKYPCVNSIDNTIDCLVENELSLSRFGDGEYNLLLGNSIAFQKTSQLIQERLREVLNANDAPCLIAIIDYVIDGMTPYTRQFWYCYIPLLIQLFERSEYANARITRGVDNHQIQRLTRIWDDKIGLFVSGEGSRFKVNHYIFSNLSKSYSLFTKSRDAFDEYDKILESVLEYVTRYEVNIVFLALGPTATILAYDLSKLGIRSLDIGHLNNRWDQLNLGKPRPELL